jgi:hypothetical protein
MEDEVGSISEARPEEGRRQIRRLLVNVGTARNSRAVLFASAAVATAMDIELIGYCVENTNLARLAALPFAREISMTSRQSRPLDSGTVAHEFKVRSEAAQRSIAALAKEASLRWRFSTISGLGEDVLADEAEQQDLLAVDLDSSCFADGARLQRFAHTALYERGASLLLLRERVLPRGDTPLTRGLRPVVAVDQGNAAGAQCCVLGARIAQGRGIILRNLPALLRDAFALAQEARILKASLFILSVEQLGAMQDCDLRALVNTCNCPLLILAARSENRPSALQGGRNCTINSKPV